MKTQLRPSALYGNFEEKGYVFDALWPASPEEDLAFLVQARSGEVLILEMRVPMVYPPIFGVDVGDSASLEAATDTLLKQMPDAPQWQPECLAAIQAALQPLGCDVKAA